MVFNKIDDFSYEKKAEDDLTPSTRKNVSLEEWKNTWMANQTSYRFHSFIKGKFPRDEENDL
jgi:hypothetical protein